MLKFNGRILRVMQLATGLLLAPLVTYAHWETTIIKIPQKYVPIRTKTKKSAFNVIKVAKEFAIVYLETANKEKYLLKFDLKNSQKDPQCIQLDHETKKVFIVPKSINENGEGYIYIKSEAGQGRTLVYELSQRFQLKKLFNIDNEYHESEVCEGDEERLDSAERYELPIVIKKINKGFAYQKSNGNYILCGDFNQFETKSYWRNKLFNRVVNDYNDSLIRNPKSELSLEEAYKKIKKKINWWTIKDVHTKYVSNSGCFVVGRESMAFLQVFNCLSDSRAEFWIPQKYQYGSVQFVSSDCKTLVMKSEEKSSIGVFKYREKTFCDITGFNYPLYKSCNNKTSKGKCSINLIQCKNSIYFFDSNGILLIFPLMFTFNNEYACTTVCNFNSLNVSGEVTVTDPSESNRPIVHIAGLCFHPKTNWVDILQASKTKLTFYPEYYKYKKINDNDIKCNIYCDLLSKIPSVAGLSKDAKHILICKYNEN